MSTVLKDGTGSGATAKVNAINRLATETISQSVEHFANIENGKAWNLLLEQTATGGNDNIFYFSNTGTTTYVFEGLSYRVASAESILIYMNSTGTPASGTTLTPANLKSSSSNAMSATVESGNNITGITDGTLIDRIYMTSTETKLYNFEQDISLEPGGTITIQAVTGGVAVSLNIFVHEKPEG